ncbi:MAG: DUF4296 domain-containing protein [Bacteroidota bacterium]|nr:DUF4296 domain-containing protein [Bacteroidota bacterium]
MFKNLLLVGLVAMVFSCTNKEIEEAPPADLLDKNRMADVMADLSLAEAVISIKTIQNPAFNTDSLVKFNVFKQNSITRKQYESNIQYYSAHPKEFKEVYDLVLKKIEGIKK